MNLYVRYFDQETVASSVDEVIEFLSSIPEIMITPALVADIKDYAASDMPYPKRYKVRPRIYFILIKTVAQTLAEFKMNKKAAPVNEVTEAQARKETKLNQLNSIQPGWYEGAIVFKRVIPIPGTSKFQYQDTRFSAYVKADSAQHCYERIVDHLKTVRMSTSAVSSRRRKETVIPTVLSVIVCRKCGSSSAVSGRRLSNLRRGVLRRIIYW